MNRRSRAADSLVYTSGKFSNAYVFVPNKESTKLESQATKMTFVGYSSQHKASLPAREALRSSSEESLGDDTFLELPPLPNASRGVERRSGQTPGEFASDEEEYFL